MEFNSKSLISKTEAIETLNQSNLSLDKQLQLAKLLLLHYQTFHYFLRLQMEKYIIACCNISLAGTIKIDFENKAVSYEVYTEKKYKIDKNKLVAIKKSKISNRKYNKEKKIAKTNLQDWTKKLLWGDNTIVRVFIDGEECYGE